MSDELLLALIWGPALISIVLNILVFVQARKIRRMLSTHVVQQWRD